MLAYMYEWSSEQFTHISLLLLLLLLLLMWCLNMKALQLNRMRRMETLNSQAKPINQTNKQTKTEEKERQWMNELDNHNDRHLCRCMVILCSGNTKNLISTSVVIRFCAPFYYSTFTVKQKQKEREKEGENRWTISSVRLKKWKWYSTGENWNSICNCANIFASTTVFSWIFFSFDKNHPPTQTCKHNRTL